MGEVSMAQAQASVDASTVAFDAGAAAATFRIYSGAKPADTDAADPSGLLAEGVFSDPAFAAAVDNADGRARADANAITGDSSINASGAAASYRCFDSNGVVVDQGTVTVTGGGGDMTVDDVDLVAGGQLNVTSHSFFMDTSG